MDYQKTALEELHTRRDTRQSKMKTSDKIIHYIILIASIVALIAVALDAVSFGIAIPSTLALVWTLHNLYWI